MIFLSHQPIPQGSGLRTTEKYCVALGREREVGCIMGQWIELCRLKAYWIGSNNVCYGQPLDLTIYKP